MTDWLVVTVVLMNWAAVSSAVLYVLLRSPKEREKDVQFCKRILRLEGTDRV